MTHRKLIEQMLAVLTSPYKWGGGLEAAKQAAITAAREYLAAPEVEPVGFFYFDDGQWKQAHDPISFPTCTKLFTHPAPEAKQEPVAYIRKDQLQKAAAMAALCEVTPEPRQDRIGIYTHPAPEAKQEPVNQQLLAELKDMGARYGLTSPARAAIAAAEQAQPAELTEWHVFNTGAEVASGLTYTEAMEYMTPERIERGWSVVCVMDKSNLAAQGAKT